MDNLLSLEWASSFLAGMPFLQYLLDLMLKSSAIIGLCYLVASVLRNRLSNNGQHLLWLSCMLCVGILPLVVAFLPSVATVFLGDGPLTVITIGLASSEASQDAVQSGYSALYLFYFFVSALLLFRLLYSAKALHRIDLGARDCTNEKDEKLVNQLGELCKSMSISRKVTLKISAAIASPMSFGMFRPRVILPIEAENWSESTLEDVLVHELSHIQRFDWVTMLFCHLLTSLYWINPLVWFAKGRVDAAAEQASDAAVLRHGKDGVNYAEELLRLARESISSRQTPVLAQLMFEESSLSQRVTNILDGRLIARASKAFIGSLLLGFVLLLSACGTIQLFGSKSYDGEITPLVTEQPLYPTRAAQRGIEGWVLAEFTINKEGRVPEQSIEVLDSEPPAIFDRTASRALARFEFTPPTLRGEPVDIEGVQYVFRFNLDEGNYQPEGQRPPPKARSRGN